MMNVLKQATTFVGLLALFAGLAWIAGYDFDTRSVWVAYCTMCAIMFSFLGTKAIHA